MVFFICSQLYSILIKRPDIKKMLKPCLLTKELTLKTQYSINAHVLTKQVSFLSCDAGDEVHHPQRMGEMEGVS